LLSWCAGLGIVELTVWALSSENRSRPRDEINELAEILAQKWRHLRIGRRTDADR